MTHQQQALKNSKKAWAALKPACRAFTLSLFLLAMTVPAAMAGGSSTQKMTYDVYASGFHAVKASVTLDITKDGRYDMFIEAKTRGFLGKLVPWSGTFESHGWVVGENDYRPELHKSTAIWKGEQDIKEYRYTRDGGFQELWITDHDKPREKKDIDPEITNGTTDALTAALEVFENYARGGKCEGESEVFDGKRRFKQIFNHEKDDSLKASRYNIYDGPAAKCTVEVVPISGKWHKKPRGWLSIQEQGRDRGTMPTVWLADISEGAPALPAKILVKTAYGALMMHLTEYQNGEDILVAEKRSGDEE